MLPLNASELVLVPAEGSSIRLAGGRRDRLRKVLTESAELAFPMLRVQPEACSGILLCCAKGQHYLYCNGMPVGVPAKAKSSLVNTLRALAGSSRNVQPVSFSEDGALKLYNMQVFRLSSAVVAGWENVLKLRVQDTCPMLLPVFSDMAALRKAVEARHPYFAQDNSLILNAQGRIVARLQDVLKSLENHAENFCAGEQSSGSRDRVHALGQALAHFVVTGESALDSPTPCHPRAGEVWSFYDPQDCGFRLWGWRWDSGIVLEALAVAARVTGDATILDAAVAAGDRMLACQLAEGECAGGFPEWVDFRYSEREGLVTEWVAPFNAAFIAAGLDELARAVGEVDQERYAASATAGYACLAKKGLTKQGGLSGYYFTTSGTWQYLGQINDSFIAGRGLSRCSETQRNEYAAIATRMALYMTDKAQQADGHVRRAWHDPAGAAPAGVPLFPEWNVHPDRVVEKIFMRGQAWALFGLAGTCRLLQGQYSAQAMQIRERTAGLAGYIMRVQRANGSWLYSQKQEGLGECVKGTAALALALAEYAAVSGDCSVVPGISKALGYLEQCSAGSIVPPSLATLPMDRSEEGGIIYYRNRPMVCAYAGALELLARVRLKELKGTV